MSRCGRGFGVAATAIVAGACLAAIVQEPAHAQGRGGRGGGPQTVPTQEQWVASAEAQRRVATAMTLAGSDLVPQAESFCTATGPLRLALARQAAGLPPIENYTIEPTRVFDNMYFIGMSSQNAWAITTSDGIILLDTLNSTEEARDVIVPSMEKVGLDPAQIKYIILGHGHPGQSDHTGGALYLQRTYGAKVVMPPLDSALILPAARPDRPLATPDMDAADGQTLTLGDTTVTLVNLPGHTPGSLGVIVPVTQNGTPHTVMTFAATQMPTRASLEQFEHVFEEFARPLKVEAAINFHAGGLQDDFALLETIRNNPTGPNPYLYSPERFDRWMSIVIECGRARLAAMGR
ncbi:MAG: MBL fold metallo-hydrolase [Acidobacteria bacterium]|nr:MBL fold metallo-hydrolase [Acidobacteriota bacterium]